MVFVEGGTFQMGDTFGDRYYSEKPVHSVTVGSFYMSKYEVTQKQWKDVMGSNPSFFKGDNLPVEQVSWYEAVKFCNKLSSKEDLTPCYTIDKSRKDPNNLNPSDKIKWTVTCNWNANGYRLPTEAEWEYAAKGGNKSKGYKYSGSKTIDAVAWYESNSDNKTHAVGSKQANELGLYDMSGNVYEWCWDWYDRSHYGKSAATNPQGAAEGSFRLLRGGSWHNNDNYCRVANRDFNYQNYRYNNTGFRFLRAIK